MYQIIVSICSILSRSSFNIVKMLCPNVTQHLFFIRTTSLWFDMTHDLEPSASAIPFQCAMTPNLFLGLHSVKCDCTKCKRQE